MKKIILAPLALGLVTLHGCYNYFPVGTQAPTISLPQQQPSGPSPQTEMGPPKPKPENPGSMSPATPPTPQTGPSSDGQPTISPEVQQQIAAQQAQCLSKTPDIQGRRAELVRCMVESTDAILNQADPVTMKERQTLGQFAIQLANQEDKGEITREEAETRYQQFVEAHTPRPSAP